jgi:hypothetical protein
MDTFRTSNVHQPVYFNKETIMDVQTDLQSETTAPNQLTDSPVITDIVAERAEPIPALALNKDPDPQVTPKADAIPVKAKRGRPPKEKTVQTANTATTNSAAKPFFAHVRYMTTKNNEKLADVTVQAISEDQARALVEQKIRSNGLRQCKDILQIDFSETAPAAPAKKTKAPKTAKASKQAKLADQGQLRQKRKYTRRQPAQPAYATAYATRQRHHILGKEFNNRTPAESAQNFISRFWKIPVAFIAGVASTLGIASLVK